jgi:peptidyl-prolyl cis-trans isomerase B (cyclophilin B)
MSDKNLVARISTEKGSISLNLFSDQAPITVASFINLVERGYYDGLFFHRVIDEFMIQGGCPLGTGTGGPGYQFDDECTTDLKHSKPGILSMANAGPSTNGSQFFITHVATPWLDGKHTVFGEVLSDLDQDIVNSIQQNDKIISIEILGDSASVKETAAESLVAWNDILDDNFPKLKKV